MHPFEIPTITVDEFVTDGVVLLDVREPEEWAAGHVDGAVHIPMNEIPSRLSYAPLDTATPIVVMCKVGGRSAHVTAWLNQQGYQARNLDGGILAWTRAGLPIVGDGDAPPEVI